MGISIEIKSLKDYNLGFLICTHDILKKKFEQNGIIAYKKLSKSEALRLVKMGNLSQINVKYLLKIFLQILWPSHNVSTISNYFLHFSLLFFGMGYTNRCIPSGFLNSSIWLINLFSPFFVTFFGLGYTNRCILLGLDIFVEHDGLGLTTTMYYLP